MSDWQAALTEAGAPCSRRSGLSALAHRPARPLPHPLGPVLLPALRHILAKIHGSGVSLPSPAAEVCAAAGASTSATLERMLVEYGFMQPPPKGEFSEFCKSSILYHDLFSATCKEQPYIEEERRDHGDM